MSEKILIRNILTVIEHRTIQSLWNRHATTDIFGYQHNTATLYNEIATP